MAEKRDILWRFLGDAKGLTKASGQAQGALGKTKKGMGGVTKAAGALGVALGGAALLDFAGDALSAATSAEEAESKFQTVFATVSEAAAAMDAWADKAGVADAAAMDLFATTGNMAQAMGFTEEASFGLTQEIATLAADLASFNDQDPATVFRNLQTAVLSTEREAIKPLVGAIAEAEVKTRALAIANEDGRDAASKQDRAIASLQIAYEGAGKAVGDLDRTFGSEANQQRRLAKRFEDLKVIIGKGVLPVVDDFTDLLEDNTDAIEDAVAGLADLFGSLGEVVDIYKKLDNLEPDWFKKVEEASFNMLNPVQAAWDAIGRLGGASEDTAPRVTRVGQALSTTVQQARDAAGAVDEAAAAAEGAALSWADLNQALDDYASRLQTLSETAFDIADETGGDAGDIFEDLDRGGTQGRGGGTRAESRPIVVNMGVVGDPYEAARVVADLLSTYETLEGARLSRVSE